jgi:hypothetical protein
MAEAFGVAGHVEVTTRLASTTVIVIALTDWSIHVSLPRSLA